MVNIFEEFELGAALRRRRKVLCISQTTLSELSGVGRHTITDIESGKGNPTIEIARKLLAPLGLRLVVRLAKEGEAPGEQAP
jgi:transcriptional regulator with XRE-family HTH domain